MRRKGKKETVTGRVSRALARLSSSALGLADHAVGVACAFDPSGQFFAEGTGDLEPLRRYEEGFLARLLAGLLPPQLDFQITKERTDKASNIRLRWAQCPSPMAALLPEEAKNLQIQIVTTADGKPPRGVVIHFPATADQTNIMRRRLLAEPLLRRGIASVLVTPPLYGRRKPAAQVYHYTRSLLDFCLMANGMIVEGWALVPWCRAQPEFAGAKVGITGVSMGGSIAAIAAAVTAGPLAVSPCLATYSGAGVYSEGVLSTQVAWGTFVREQSCSLAEARKHVARVLNAHDVHNVIDDIRTVPNLGPRSLAMLNAADDKYVTAAEARHLFSALAPTCAQGDASLSFISGGHASSVLLGAPAFVRNICLSFDVLERRLAAICAEQQTAQAAGSCPARPADHLHSTPLPAAGARPAEASPGRQQQPVELAGGAAAAGGGGGARFSRPASVPPQFASKL